MEDATVTGATFTAFGSTTRCSLARRIPDGLNAGSIPAGDFIKRITAPLNLERIRDGCDIIWRIVLREGETRSL